MAENYTTKITRRYTQESLGLYELKQHKPWFDEECLGFLDQRKRVKMQWLQNPNQSNEIICTVSDVKLVELSGTKITNIYES